MLLLDRKPQIRRQHAVVEANTCLFSVEILYNVHLCGHSKTLLRDEEN